MKIKAILTATICFLLLPFSCFAEETQVEVYVNGTEAKEIVEYDADIVRSVSACCQRSLDTDGSRINMGKNKQFGSAF